MIKGKTKILFHYSRLNIGGAEKSIVRLANFLVNNNFDVTIVLNVGQGSLEHKLDKKIEVIHFFPKPWKLKIVSQKTIFRKMMFFIMYGLPVAYYSLTTYIKKRNFKNSIYDAAIISLQGLNPEFVCNYVTARKKYIYLRSDLSKLDTIQISINLTNFNKSLDGYLCVSKTVLDSLDAINPLYKNKAHVVYNMVDIDEINKLANQEVCPYDKTNDSVIPILVTVCRMSDVSKAIFRQIDAALILKNEGYKFKWYFVGDGSDLSEFKNKIIQNGLDDCIFTVGEKKNPYPYIKHADLVCVLSNYEGLSGVVNEAKFLGRALIATEFSGIHEQIINRQNGLIVPNDLEGIIEGLRELLSNQELRLMIQNNFLGSGIAENNSKLEKLVKIIAD